MRGKDAEQGSNRATDGELRPVADGNIRLEQFLEALKPRNLHRKLLVCATDASGTLEAPGILTDKHEFICAKKIRVPPKKRQIHMIDKDDETLL